jgi:F-type H+-transporting ATPase subunit b
MNLNATLIGQSIAFLIFVILTMKYVWPPITKAMQERQRKIAEGLEAAKRGQHDLELSQKKSADIIHQAKSESAKIFEKANHKRIVLIENARLESRIASQRLLMNTKKDIEYAVQQAKEEMRDDVVDIVVKSLEKILTTEQRQHIHKRLIKELIEQMEQP